MIFKIIFVILILFIIYLIFFKKSRKTGNKSDNLITDEMVECPSCRTYVSQRDAILSNGKFYCSKECLGVKR